MEDERFKSLSRMLRYELKSTMKIEDVIPKLPSYIIGIEKTGDIYLDFSYYCAIVIIDNTPKVQEGMITAIGVIRRLLEIVISWGIYPHLPKSLHIPFLDDPHWLMTPAPPRMLRPKPEMLQALEIFITSPGVQLIHPLFLHHCICIFYYLEPARLNLIIQDQPTENVISCLIALFQTGLEFGPLLISVIQERTDSFEAIERTKFPIKLCARAISVPPKNVSNDEYFDKLFPRLITAINSGKGSDLSKEIISEIINHNINEFFKHFDMHLLLEWPTYKSISPIIFQLDNIIYDDDIPKVLITPIPQRLLFIASNENVNETIREKIISLLKKYFKDEKSSIELIKSIIEVETLSPLGIDHINLLTNENGIFVVENDNDDDFDALENMRNLIVDKIIVNENQIKDFIDWFPPTMSSIDFVSKILMKYKEIDNDLASSLLLFLSKFEGKNEFLSACEIAKIIISLCPNLKEINENIYNAFKNEIPEIELFKIIEKNSKKIDNENELNLDKIELLHELNSPIEPLRAHALYTLRKSVMTKGNPLRENENIIKSFLPTIKKQLQNKDSFIYMSAIKCLESLADVFPHLIIEDLTEQFPQKDEILSIKISQVLMLCVRRTGPGLIYSANGNLCGYFIKAFLRGVNHKSEIVVASSLSNLASFVEALEFGCANWFTDIVNILNLQWQIHKPLEIRRAASFLAYKIVLTFGNSFEEFARKDLEVLIECVERMRTGELDQVAYQNAEDCYQTLWEICPMLM